MREIKFRAWDKQDKIFEYVELLPGGHMDLPEWKREIEDWQQFTGLKDKNGKEIYEGDIVKTGDGIKAVEWKGGAWGYSNVMWNDAYEVIGNIHENPELLK